MSIFGGSILLAAALASVHLVTVQQLKETLAAAHAARHSDARIANEVGSLEMTQRITEEQFIEITRSEKPATKQALRLLADASAFLDPPASEIPNDPAPTAAEQKALLGKAFTYTLGYVGGLPDFRCTQTTTRFDDDAGRQRAATLASLGDSDTTAWQLQASASGPRRFTERDILTAEVTFVRGAESRVPARAASHADTSRGVYSLTGLTTAGEFGGMMNSLFSEKSDAQFRSSHWERIAAQRVAVLAFDVDRAHSDFFIDWCCVDKAVRHERVAYHGQLFLDPDSGVIRRLWWRARDIPDAIPTRSSATLVEYAPVAIGVRS